MRYCPKCKQDFQGDGPPYSVMHVDSLKVRAKHAPPLPATHIHPVTREHQLTLDTTKEKDD